MDERLKKLVLDAISDATQDYAAGNVVLAQQRLTVAKEGYEAMTAAAQYAAIIHLGGKLIGNS